MSKTLLVAQHEFMSNIKKRSFIIAAIGAPLFIIALMGVIILVSISAETDTSALGVIGYVDQADVITNLPADLSVEYRAYADVDSARAALDASEIGAYFVLAENYRQSGRVDVISSTNFSGGVEGEVRYILRSNLSESVDPDLAERIADPVANNVIRALDSGRDVTTEGVLGLFLAPILFIMVFMLASQSTSGYLMSSVVEEKSGRIMEILITSVTPMQLLFGKIIGLGLLGLVQVAIWGVVFIVVLFIGRDNPAIAGVYIPTDMVITTSIYFLLTYFLLASIMAGAGAVIGSEQESRQFAGIFSLGFAIPFILIINFLTDPNGPIVLALTLIPFTSPVAVILRMAFGTVPAWQLALSIGILLATTIIVIWASARIFRWSLLMYGKRPSFRQVIGLLGRRRLGLGTSASGEAA